MAEGQAGGTGESRMDEFYESMEEFLRANEHGTEGIFILKDGQRLVVLDEHSLVRAMPHCKVIQCVLLLCIRDEVDEVWVGPVGTDEEGCSILQMCYVSKGETFQLVPAPGQLGRPIIDELKKAAGIGSLRNRIARLLRRWANRIEGAKMPTGEGNFQLDVAEMPCKRIRAWVYDAKPEDRIVLQFLAP